MAACHCEWRFANAPLAVASLIFFLIFSYFMEKKHNCASGSGAFSHRRTSPPSHV
jgi:hypothetical protein